MTRTHLDYTMTLTRPDGSVVKTITVPVTTLVTGWGDASSRLSLPYDAEQQLRADIGGLASVASKDANNRAIAACQTIELEAVDSGMGDVLVLGPALLEPFADAGFTVRVSDLENDWRPLQGVLPDALLTDALYERILAKGYYGELQDHQTGEGIRSATPTELRDSIEAAQRDGGAGVIVIDGRRCFVS